MDSTQPQTPRQPRAPAPSTLPRLLSPSTPALYRHTGPQPAPASAPPHLDYRNSLAGNGSPLSKPAGPLPVPGERSIPTSMSIGGASSGVNSMNTVTAGIIREGEGRIDMDVRPKLEPDFPYSAPNITPSATATSADGSSRKRKRHWSASPKVARIDDASQHSVTGADSQQLANADSLSAIDAIISQKRKPREKTSCHPCRKRKVGCDKRLPCQTCVDRRHPECCIYEAVKTESRHPNQPYSVRSVSVENELAVPRDYMDRLMMRMERMEKTLGDLTSDVRALSQYPSSGPSPETNYANSPRVSGRLRSELGSDLINEGIHTRNELTGQTVHVGGFSVPALVLALAKRQTESIKRNELTSGQINLQELLGPSILPLFGLDNESVTYPFMDLWSATQSPLTKIKQVCEALPKEDDCKSFFLAYRDIAYAVYPAVAELGRFEEELDEFHISRSRAGEVTEQSVHGKSIDWMALLFAVLAAGCQCSDLPRRSRDLTSKVFVCCSFECLRVTNFLSCPSLESIQALLVFGNVIANMYNAGVSWAMIGLTNRLAQTLGLHKECKDEPPTPLRLEKSKVWWAVLWQDSLLSITYDRASSTVDSYFPHPTGNTYEDCMYRLCRVGLDIVRERNAPQDPEITLLRMAEHEQHLADIHAAGADHLKNESACKTKFERLRYWAFYLHKSYVLSELCRPAISPTAPQTDLTARFKRTCIDSLANTVQAFLGLAALTSFARRSWAIMHRSLSSAMLLGILGEPAHNSTARRLLSEMLDALGDITAGMDQSEISAPVERAMKWLKKFTSDQPVLPVAVRINSTAPTPPENESPYALLDQMIWGGKGSP